jgi:hypothetical protein
MGALRAALPSQPQPQPQPALPRSAAAEQFPALGAATYVPPPNVAERNAALIASIKKAVAPLGDDGFNQFKDVSMRYRRGDVSAAQYYAEFCRICGADAARIFPELVALLPDTAKQHALLQAHNDARAKAQADASGPGSGQPRVLIVKSAPQGQANQPWQSTRAAQAQPPAATFKYAACRANAVSGRLYMDSICVRLLRRTMCPRCRESIVPSKMAAHMSEVHGVAAWK